MPKEKNDNEGGGGAGVIELQIGDEKQTFADVKELQEAYLDYRKKHAELAESSKDMPRLKRVEELARATVLVGTEDAERQFYKELGLSDREIREILENKASDNDDDDEDEDDEDEDDDASNRSSRKASRNGRGAMPDPEALVGEVLKRLSGKLSLKHLDEESLSIMRDIVARVDSASSVVSESGIKTVESQMEGDKIISKYWKGLGERQKKAALDIVLDKTVGKSLKSGRRPTSDDVEKIRKTMRNYLADIYGPPESFRGVGSDGVPPVLDIGVDSTGLEELSDEELSEKISKLNSLDSDDDREGGLAARMFAALEKSKRKR